MKRAQRRKRLYVANVLGYIDMIRRLHRLIEQTTAAGRGFSAAMAAVYKQAREQT